MEPRRYDLRYLLTSLILDAGGVASIAELRGWLDELGVSLGPDPRHRIFGALRSEVRKRRLRPLGDGRYEIDELPRGTRDRIRRHARAIERALAAGEGFAPPRHRWTPRSGAPLASPFRDAVGSGDRLPGGTPTGWAARREKATRNAHPRASDLGCGPVDDDRI